MRFMAYLIIFRLWESTRLIGSTAVKEKGKKMHPPVPNSSKTLDEKLIILA